MRIAERFFGPGSRTQPILNGTTHAADAIQPPAVALPLVLGEMWSEERARVAVSRNSSIVGKLSYQGPVRIDGKLRGEVTSTEVIVISETATVEGKVRAPRVLVLGSLAGEVAGAETVIIGPSAHAKGKIQAERLTVCEGARVEADIAVGESYPYRS
jgi:cytoskeletal protein CcmA (bactofilin family)